MLIWSASLTIGLKAVVVSDVVVALLAVVEGVVVVVGIVVVFVVVVGVVVVVVPENKIWHIYYNSKD